MSLLSIEKQIKIKLANEAVIYRLKYPIGTETKLLGKKVIIREIYGDYKSNSIKVSLGFWNNIGEFKRIDLSIDILKDQEK